MSEEHVRTTSYSESNRWCDFFEKEVRAESPRAMAILSVAVLEEALTCLVRGALLPCPTSVDPLFDGGYVPLGTFSAKIDFAGRMGLISAGVSQSLHLIRKIRNDFAHDISGCSFDRAEVRNRVRELKRLNDVAKRERRAHFPDGAVGDFQASVSWLIFWLWHRVESVPRRCPECGMLHKPKGDLEPTDESIGLAAKPVAAEVAPPSEAE
jgi:hypothetical protein